MESDGTGEDVSSGREAIRFHTLVVPLVNRQVLRLWQFLLELRKKLFRICKPVIPCPRVPLEQRCLRHSFSTPGWQPSESTCDSLGFRATPTYSDVSLHSYLNNSPLMTSIMHFKSFFFASSKDRSSLFNTFFI